MSSGPSQRYLFVHRALPSVLFRDPSWLHAVLGGPDAMRLLGDLWERVGKQAEPGSVGPPVGMGVEVFHDGAHLFALIAPPPPLAEAEAHLAAVVSGFADPTAPSLSALAWSRFFTLERGIDLTTESPCTFLCEWTREGRHRNFGVGPEPEPGAFVRALAERLAGG